MRGWRRRLREVLQRRQVEREAIEELTLHVDALAQRHIAAGIDAPEAWRRARAEAGSVEAARELLAEGRTGHALEQVGREARQAFRVLRRSPGLTLLSVATMGIGIGAGAVLFALVDAVVLRPLPYPEPERLVRLVDSNRAAGVDRSGVAAGNLHDWRRRVPALAGVAGYYAMGRTLTLGDRSEVVIAAQVTADFFAVAGVPPLLGRTFTADEIAQGLFSDAAMPVGGNPVVVLSHGLWQSRFGADPGVVGRSLTLERIAFTVVGVMPAGFALPDRGVQLWMPWHLAADDPRDQHYLGAIGRLAPGVSPAIAQQQLTLVGDELATIHPDTNTGWRAVVLPLHEDLIGGAAGILWLLLGAVGLLLLVACANVALLTLLRGLDRAGEAAVRLALGASARRLLREFLFESAWLAGLGGAAAALLALAAVRALPALAPDLPRVEEVRLDARAFLFLAGATTLAALLAGVPQAWRRTRLAPAAALSETTLRASDARGRHRLRDAMVVAQVALAVVLLMGSGLLVRSVQRLGAVDLGFDPRGVLVAPVFLDSQAYANGERTRTYYRTLFERLQALPGVVAVGGATTVPASPLGPDFERPVWPEGAAEAPAAHTPAAVRMVTPGYFPALGLRIVGGRAIDGRDTPVSPRVVMVSDTLARRLWPGGDAVGRRLIVDYSTAGTYPYEVVGVVGDLRFRGPRSAPQPEIYLPHAQRSYLILNVVIRTTGEPRALIPAVQAALRAVDPQKPAHLIQPLEDLLGATYARDRQVMATLLVFAGAATFLALLSVYGVLAQRVRERAREIGIRMAMGADAAGLVGWVARSGARLIGVGLAVGLLVAAAASRALADLLFGVAPDDAATAGGVAAVIGAAGLAATLVPAWRATRIDPVAVLRRG